MNRLLEAIALLENVTPLKSDCGTLCDHACCKPDKDAGGEVWLLPCEEEMDFDWAEVHPTRMPVTETDAYAISCASMCDRAKRPFLCRIFPLVPYYSKKRNEWDVRMDRRAWMLCPLCNYGVKGLNPEFVSAARQAVQILCEDAETEDFLQKVHLEEDAYRIKL